MSVRIHPFVNGLSCKAGTVSPAFGAGVKERINHLKRQEVLKNKFQQERSEQSSWLKGYPEYHSVLFATYFESEKFPMSGLQILELVSELQRTKTYGIGANLKRLAYTGMCATGVGVLVFLGMHGDLREYSASKNGRNKIRNAYTFWVQEKQINRLIEGHCSSALKALAAQGLLSRVHYDHSYNDDWSSGDGDYVTMTPLGHQVLKRVKQGLTKGEFEQQMATQAETVAGTPQAIQDQSNQLQMMLGLAVPGVTGWDILKAFGEVERSKGWISRKLSSFSAPEGIFRQLNLGLKPELDLANRIHKRFASLLERGHLEAHKNGEAFRLTEKARALLAKSKDLPLLQPSKEAVKIFLEGEINAFEVLRREAPADLKELQSQAHTVDSDIQNAQRLITRYQEDCRKIGLAKPSDSASETVRQEYLERLQTAVQNYQSETGRLGYLTRQSTELKTKIKAEEAQLSQYLQQINTMILKWRELGWSLDASLDEYDAQAVMLPLSELSQLSEQLKQGEKIKLKGEDALSASQQAQRILTEMTLQEQLQQILQQEPVPHP